MTFKPDGRMNYRTRAYRQGFGNTCVIEPGDLDEIGRDCYVHLEGSVHVTEEPMPYESVHPSWSVSPLLEHGHLFKPDLTCPCGEEWPGDKPCTIKSHHRGPPVKKPRPEPSWEQRRLENAEVQRRILVATQARRLAKQW